MTSPMIGTVRPTKTPMLRVQRILKRRTLPSVSVGRMSFSILKSRCLRATRDAIDVPIVAPFGLRFVGRNAQMPYRGPGLRPSLPSISSPRAICRADEQSGIIRELCEIRFTFFLSSEFVRVAFLFPESVRTLHWHHVGCALFIFWRAML